MHRPLMCVKTNIIAQEGLICTLLALFFGQLLDWRTETEERPEKL